MNGGEKVGVQADGIAEPLSKQKIAMSKQHKKMIRMFTVMAYVFSVSLGAIVLSLYYVFLWDPNMQRDPKHLTQTSTTQMPDFHHLKSQENSKDYVLSSSSIVDLYEDTANDSSGGALLPGEW